MSADGFTRMSIYGINLDLFSSSPIVILKVEDENRYLPIWIGQSEAAAIALEQQGVEPARPLTHDLIRDLIAALGHSLKEVRIVDLQEGTFYADLIAQIAGPVVKAGKAGARDRADDLAREVAALAITLHTSLIKSAVRDVLDR